MSTQDICADKLAIFERIAADVKSLTSGRLPEVQMGIGDAGAIALLESIGATEMVYHYNDSPSIRTMTIVIGGVSFTAQVEVAR